MTKAEIIKLLTVWQEAHDETEKFTDGCYELLGLEIDSAALELLWTNFDLYTKTLAALVGDKDEWMAWHFCDNQMGRSRLKARASKEKKLRSVKNIKNLTTLIIESTTK